MSDKRVKWLDDSRGIAVFGVLLAHSQINHPIFYSFYTLFFLTLFFFISGFLYNYKSLKENLNKIFSHLLIPYFCLNFLIIFLGIDNWVALFNANYSFLLKKFLSVFLGYQMWFVPCLILVQLYMTALHWLYMKNFSTKTLTLLVLFSSVYIIKNQHSEIMPWYSDIALFAGAFFLLGNIVKGKIGFKNWLPKVKHPKILSIVLLTVYASVAIFVQPYLNMEFHFAYNFYEKPTLFIILALFGIFAICIFFQTFHFNFFNYLGQNSLTFFAFNGKARSFAMLFFAHIPIVENHLFVLLLCCFESLILMIISLLLNKYAPFLIGKTKKRVL